MSKHAKPPKANFKFTLSEDAVNISESLLIKIKNTIKDPMTEDSRIEDSRIENSHGTISFQQYMQMALYEPGVGYYQNNLHKFGEQGDFITAPEMGKLFARCLANSLAGLMPDPSTKIRLEKQTSNFAILEIGAGSGRLAVDLLKALRKKNRLPRQYFILEPSATLQSQQSQLLKEQLPDFFEKIHWLAELPADFEGVIIANEVIDAIPCELIEKRSGRWCRVEVGLLDEHLTEVIGNEIDASNLPLYLVNIERNYEKKSEINRDYLDGYRTEMRPLAKGWINALSKCLKTGAIILIDYGYPQAEFYHPQRTQGSLTCFINHHRHDDPYQYIGVQDITAHVDFTHIAQVASDSGLDVAGFTTQAGFLLENGITQMVDANTSQYSVRQRAEISAEIQKLLMPGQMGEVIKVMLLEKNANSQVIGFTMQDHLHRLV